MSQPGIIVYSTADVSNIPMADDDNTFTGSNTFSGTTTFNVLNGTIGTVKTGFVIGTVTGTAGTINTILTVGTVIGTSGTITTFSNSGGTATLNVLTGTIGTISTLSLGTATGTYGSIVTFKSGGTTQFGDAANYVKINEVGEMTFNGSATVWDDLQVNMNAVRVPVAGSPGYTAYKGGYVLAFDKADVETIYFNAQLPHSYKENSNIDFHLHLTHPDGSAGDSVWEFTHSWASINGAFPTQSTVVATVSSCATADINQVVEIDAAIAGTTKGVSSLLVCSLARIGTSAGDTYDNDIYLPALDFHFEKDMVGSKTRSAK